MNQINLYDHLLQHQVNLNPGTTKDDWMDVDSLLVNLSVPELVNKIFFSGKKPLYNMVSRILKRFITESYEIRFLSTNTDVKIVAIPRESEELNEDGTISLGKLSRENLLELLNDQLFVVETSDEATIDWNSKQLKLFSDIYFILQYMVYPNASMFKLPPEEMIQVIKQYTAFELVRYFKAPTVDNPIQLYWVNRP